MEEPILKEETKKLNLFEYTTIIYAFLTFLGYVYIDTYFNYWGISIYSFLDVSEILLLFLKNLNSLFISLCTLTIALFLNAFIQPSYDADNPYKIILFNNRINIFILLVPIGIILAIALYNIKFDLYLLYVAFSITLLMYFYLIDKGLTKFKNHYNLPIDKYILKVILILIFFYSLSYISAKYEYKKISTNYTETSFKFICDTTTYKSNDKFLFIGSTSKYIFLRNTKDSANLIFDKSSIKNLSLTEKHNTT